MVVITPVRNPINFPKAQLLMKSVVITTPTTAMVQSLSGDKMYVVDMAEGSCECPDSKFRNRYCIHCLAADLKVLFLNRNSWGRSK